MTGGSGNDIYVIQDAGDVTVEDLNQGNDTIQATITYSIEDYLNIENITLMGVLKADGKGNSRDNILQGNIQDNILDGLAGNDRLNGGKGNDVLIGGHGNDILFGEDGNDILTGTSGLLDINLGLGKNEFDRLTGGKGSDTFVLSSSDGIFYDDGDGASAGTSDYAWITDFKSAEADKIKFYGQSSDYLLKSLNIGSVKGMGVYLNDGKDSNGVLISGWDSKDELIGFIQGYTNTNLGSSDFWFVQPSTQPA